jgi:hypothetical protein
VAVVRGNFTAGPIYTSTDTGTNWFPSVAPSNNWAGVASSADGRSLVAVESGGGIYTLQIPPPALSIVKLGTNLMVSWPAGATGNVLQSTPDLRTASWVAVTNPPTLINGTKQMLLPNSTRTNQFYRLIIQ